MGEFIIECTLCGASFGCERDYDSHPCLEEDVKVPFRIKMEPDEEEAELENETLTINSIAASLEEQCQNIVVKQEILSNDVEDDMQDPLALVEKEGKSEDNNDTDTGTQTGVQEKKKDSTREKIVEDKGKEASPMEEEVELMDRLDPNTIVEKVTDAVSVRNECGICGKRFYRREDCLNHTTNSHKIPRPHQCKVCKKRFTQKHYVTLHMRVHTGEKPYKCTLCSNTYTHKTSFTIHMRIHNGDRPYMCGVCGKRCYDKSGLTSHMRSHTKETPYECEVCGRRFTHSKSLLVHRRNHTGEKPYECSYCGKCFRHWHKHKIHIRLHTGERPYKCEVCGKGFPRNDEVKRHMRSHTGIKSFKCSICGVYCATQASITGHIDLHHADLRQISPDAPEKTVVKNSKSGILGTKAPQPRTIYKPIKPTQAIHQITTPLMRKTPISKPITKSTVTSSDKIQTINGERTKILSYKEYIELQEKLLLCKGLKVKNPKPSVSKPLIANVQNKEGSSSTKSSKINTILNGSQGKQIVFITPQGQQKNNGMRLIMPQQFLGNNQVLMSTGGTTGSTGQPLMVQQQQQQPSVILPQGQIGGGQQIILLSKPGTQQNPMMMSQPILLLSGPNNSQRMILLNSNTTVQGLNKAGGAQTLFLPSTVGNISSTTTTTTTTTTPSAGVVVKQEPGEPSTPTLAIKPSLKEEKGSKLPNAMVIKQEPLDEDIPPPTTTDFYNIKIKQEPQD